METSKLEILKETLEFYKTNPRSVKDGEYYYTLQITQRRKTHDPVGRCFFAKYKQENNSLINKHLFDLNQELNLDEYLLKKYRGHNIIFWLDLQAFHDNDEFWINGVNKASLSAHGKERFDFLKKYYNE